MSTVLRIAAAELRYWRHSRLILLMFATLLGLMLLSVFSAALHIGEERRTREANQAHTRERFLAQPARHPHRMVHYGHYVYRVPPPLAVLEPGVDAFTGRSIFLEGHRQNSATFAAVQETSLLARFGDLSPAFIVQAVAPLVLILIGHASVVRERESGTLIQLWSHGVRPWQLLAGKAVALSAVALSALTPVAAAALWTLVEHVGEMLPAAIFLLATALYLAIWICAVLAVSSHASRRWTALSGLLAGWLLIVVIVPRVAADVAQALVPVPGTTADSLQAGAVLRAAGDGHDSRSPAFASFTREVLERYGATSVEALPVNIRGLVMMEGERKSAEIQQGFAARRSAREAAQAGAARRFAALSPALALRWAAMTSVGTDLSAYHRFLVAAEAHRYEFVQALNRLHAEALDYADDVRRSGDRTAEQRTRISATHWALLPEFDAAPAAATARAHTAALPTLLLGAWLAVALLLLRRAADAVGKAA